MIRQTIHSIQKKLHTLTANISTTPKKRLFSTSFLSRKRHEIYAWGDATHGQIGNGIPHGAVGIPSLVEELAADLRFRSIGTGQFHSMAITEQGHLYSWGRAGFQDESPDKSLTSVTPLRINGPWKDDAIISASGGRAHTTIVSKKGNVYSWGNGHNFQLGHGDGKDQSMPKLVDALLGQQAVKISSGWGHNLILTAEGKVWSWGWNQDGQLGIGSTEHSAVPRQVPGLTGVKIVDVAAGSDHSLLLTSEGTVIAFGLGEMGQLGRGNKDTSTGPVLVQFPPNVKITSIAAGFAHCLAISDKGELFTWGWNSDGQLGLEDTEDRTTPTIIAMENKTKLIACGRVNSLCYTDANLMYSWGSAQSGRLGTGARVNQLIPDIVDELSQPELNVLAISCGLDHVLALVERE